MDLPFLPSPPINRPHRADSSWLHAVHPCKEDCEQGIRASLGRGDGETQVYVVSHNSPWTSPLQLTTGTADYNNPSIIYDQLGHVIVLSGNLMLDGGADDDSQPVDQGLSFTSLEAVLAATVTGAVFHDVDSDGQMAPDEDALANWTVYIDSNGNGALDADEISTVTDEHGAFTFNDPPAAEDVTLRPVLQAGWYDVSVGYMVTDRYDAGVIDQLLTGSLLLCSI